MLWSAARRAARRKSGALVSVAIDVQCADDRSNVLIRPLPQSRALRLGEAFLGATMTSSQAGTHDLAPTFQRDEGILPIVVPSPALVCSINADSHALAITSSDLT